MRAGEKIGVFGKAVDGALADLKKILPEDLIMFRTSDQPLQVKENIDLFMNSLYEAIALVVLVSWIGFWSWRLALLMSISIPLTLGMTFGMMFLLGIDLQQVSIASLIIALGLLVDVPVVAGDAIKRELGAGHKPVVAAWLGPTKLATAIVFATITNIVAYLPFLMVGGDTGRFIYSLPIVMACSLIASRIVSMTFIPLLGYYLLRPPKTLEAPIAGAAPAWVPGALLQVWAPDDRASVAFYGGLPGFPGRGRFCHVEAAYRLFSQGPFLSLLCGCLAAGGRAGSSHGCHNAPGRSRPARRSGGIRERASRTGR